MKSINAYIIKKFKISKDIKDPEKNMDNTMVANKLHTFVFTDFSSERNVESLRAFIRWTKENDVIRFKGYFDNTTHLGGGVSSSIGNIDYSPDTVKEYMNRLTKSSCISLYSSRKFGIVCNEILKKSDTPILYISTPDTRFIILKDN